METYNHGNFDKNKIFHEIGRYPINDINILLLDDIFHR